MRPLLLAFLLVSLPAVAKPGGSPPAPPGQELNAQDQKAIHDYRLTVANAEKVMEANRRLKEAVQKDPSLMEHGAAQAKTIDDSVKRLESKPAAKAVLDGLGLTSREFVVGTFTIVSAVVWHSIKQSQPQMQVPAYVNAENIRFFDQHPELIKKWSGK